MIIMITYDIIMMMIRMIMIMIMIYDDMMTIIIATYYHCIHYILTGKWPNEGCTRIQLGSR